MEDKQTISGITFKEKLDIMNGDDRSISNLNSSSLNEIQEIYMPEASTHMSISTVLNYCKSKIIQPYLKFLSFVGLLPLVTDEQVHICWKFLSFAYFIQGILLIIIGYILQYMACFRRDRGFYYIKKSDYALVQENADSVYEQTCDTSFMFSFIIPSILHLSGYLHAVIITRRIDDEQIPVLMERVFILSTHLSSGIIGQKRLVRTLWTFVAFSIIWMVSSFALVNYMMAEGDIYFKWIPLSPPWLIIVLKILLIICTLWHDIVQATIISNYCLQVQLLNSYVLFLREKMLQYAVQPLEWMRDIEDFKKLLKYLNEKMAPSVCLLMIVNISYMISGILWLFHFDQLDSETLPLFGLSVSNVLLWTCISTAPFIQAARLSNSCEVLKTVGQEARARPYVHLDTPILELDSVLMYTTSLKINAKLYQVPITGRKLCFCIATTAVIILVLGQGHYFSEDSLHHL